MQALAWSKTHTHTLTYTQTHTDTHRHTLLHTHTHTQTYTHTHTHIHTQTHTLSLRHTHTQTHTHRHTQTHKHTQTHTQSCWTQYITESHGVQWRPLLLCENNAVIHTPALGYDGVSNYSYTLYKWKYPVRAGNIVLILICAGRNQLWRLKWPPPFFLSLSWGQRLISCCVVMIPGLNWRISCFHWYRSWISLTLLWLWGRCTGSVCLCQLF